MAEPELRQVTEEGWLEWGRTVERGFHDTVSDEDLRDWRTVHDLDRTIAVVEGDRIIGTGANLSFTVSVPGGEPVPCAGVTAITVASDRRRRGVLTRMMDHLLDDAVARGEPVAALYASESPIYGRFGFGLAADAIDLRFEAAFTTLRTPVDASAVELVTGDEAIARFPALYDRERTRRGGMMSRSDAWWRAAYGSDRDAGDDGLGPRMHAWLPDRGFVVYRVKGDWTDGVPNGLLRTELLVATDDDARAILYRFLLDVDLVSRYELRMQPVDDPLPFLVSNQARIARRGGFPLWIRVLDPAAALQARRYAADLDVVLELTDPFRSANAGRWRLVVRDGQATVERTDAAADATLDVGELGSLWLGGFSARQLAQAGRIRVHADGLPLALDQAFATHLAPWNGFEF